MQLWHEMRMGLLVFSGIDGLTLVLARQEIKYDRADVHGALLRRTVSPFPWMDFPGRHRLRDSQLQIMRCGLQLLSKSTQCTGAQHINLVRQLSHSLRRFIHVQAVDETALDDLPI